MENDLQRLIKMLEEEKQSLLQFIDVSVKEHEYLSAHFYSTALEQLNARLQILNNLDDDLYDTKRLKLSMIESMQRRLASESSHQLKEYLIQQIRVYEQELQVLTESTIESAKPTQDRVVEQHFILLLNRKLLAFKIILNESDDLMLEIKRVKRTIRITVPYVHRLEKKYLLHEARFNKFLVLGFQRTPKGDKLVMTLSGEKEEILQRIRILLSIVVFDIFSFKEFRGKAFIKT